MQTPASQTDKAVNDGTPPTNALDAMSDVEFDAAMSEIYAASDRLADLYRKAGIEGAACITRLLTLIVLSDLADYNIAVLHRIAGLMAQEDEENDRKENEEQK